VNIPPLPPENTEYKMYHSLRHAIQYLAIGKANMLLWGFHSFSNHLYLPLVVFKIWGMSRTKRFSSNMKQQYSRFKPVTCFFISLPQTLADD